MDSFLREDAIRRVLTKPHTSWAIKLIEKKGEETAHKKEQLQDHASYFSSKQWRLLFRQRPPCAVGEAHPPGNQNIPSRLDLDENRRDSPS